VRKDGAVRLDGVDTLLGPEETSTVGAVFFGPGPFFSQTVTVVAGVGVWGGVLVVV
jgi:hypothetical protein